MQQSGEEARVHYYMHVAHAAAQCRKHLKELHRGLKQGKPPKRSEGGWEGAWGMGPTEAKRRWWDPPTKCSRARSESGIFCGSSPGFSVDMPALFAGHCSSVSLRLVGAWCVVCVARHLMRLASSSALRCIGDEFSRHTGAFL